MREKNELLDETTWRIIREAKGIAGWVAVSAVLGILAVLCSIAAPEILGNLIQKLYDFGLSDRQTPIRDSLRRTSPADSGVRGAGRVPLSEYAADEPDGEPSLYL